MNANQMVFHLIFWMITGWYLNQYKLRSHKDMELNLPDPGEKPTWPHLL